MAEQEKRVRSACLTGDLVLPFFGTGRDGALVITRTKKQQQSGKMMGNLSVKQAEALSR